ncbi:transglutaminase superfamily protein [Chitinophaga japonensis]|uniref:Transglutaminase superfamily protein n=2 Tax=Chitinophaga japonensis TaxID=104662 RepID=A0A562T6E2_CHIJA|nr:transglutaminase superfamily protein [Chitinophaga japonensis]
MPKLLHIFCTAGLLAWAVPVLAGDPAYPAAAIPAELKEKAHTVKRREEIRFRMTGLGEARLTRHYVITVLDPAGSEDAGMLEVYDRLREIRSIRGVLYDAGGKTIKRLKQSDIEDLGGLDNMSLASDDRLKKHIFYHNVYPYTVEYEIEMRFNCTFIFPSWMPQSRRNMAVEQSRLVVSVPESYKLRYRQFHYGGAPQVTTGKGESTYTWEAKQLKVHTAETLAPAWWRCVTSVWLSPSEFEMERYKGSMNTWEEFGKFMYTLNEGRDRLPPDVQQTVHALTDGLADPAEKIKRLYRYLQEHTRYVSIQLGIGGWQTFDAAYVAGKGYGDCKALSNYMHALLKEAGVPSYCALISAGRGDTDFEPDFPSNQFNHMILCVPAGRDTTWLECTSAFLPAGYLSGFTSNRPALLVMEQGGKLVRTPVYGVEQSRQARRMDAQVTPEGHVQARVSTYYTGERQDELGQRLHVQSREKIMEWIRTSLSLPSYDVEQYNCVEQPGAVPAIREELALTARNYASISGKRMFLAPNFLNKSSLRVDAATQRRFAIHLPVAYTETDTVRIAIPAGYTPESLPAPVALQSPFGSYTASVKVQDGTLTYIRTMQHREGTFPASAFSELEKFSEAVYKADRSRIVLRKE